MNGAHRVAYVGLLAASVAACESPLSPSELRALARAQGRWAARSFQDYAFEIRRSCFCEPSVTQWARVEVVSGGVSRVVFVDSGIEVGPAERARYPTVEQVFSRIRTGSDNEWVDDVTVEFDGQLGFPIRVTFSPKSGILDAGETIFLRNVGPIT